MYFSRVSINPSTVDVKHLAGLACADGYREHQQLWRLFDEDPDAKRDFLFRREQVNGWPRFFIVSARKPTKTDGIWNIENREYEPKLHSGQQLAFSLRVNPVVTRTGDDGKKHRHDVVMNLKKQIGYQQVPGNKRPPLIHLVEQAGLEWLEKRAEKHGFVFNAGTVRVDAYTQNRAFKKRNNQPIHYSTLDFKGVLTVIEPDIFKATLYGGVGPAKAFGCGLLLVRRI